MEVHSLLVCIADLLVVGRHIVTGSAVDDVNLRRAKPRGDPRRIHRHVAAADDSDPFAGNLRGLPQIGFPEEPNPFNDATRILAWYAHLLRIVSTQSQEDRLEALLPQIGDGEVLSQSYAGPDVDAQGEDVLDLVFQD